MTLFDELVEYANKNFDGHFTVMKFTTNWRVGFGAPMERTDIDLMWDGNTFEEAARRALTAGYSKNEQGRREKLAMYEQWDRELQEFVENDRGEYDEWEKEFYTAKAQGEPEA